MPHKFNNPEIIDLVNNSETVDLANDITKSHRKSARKNQRRSTEIKNETVVLVVDCPNNNVDLDRQRLITLEGSHPYSSMPLILEQIFPTEEILMDHIGYKLVNDYTERRVEVSEPEDLIRPGSTQHIQYVIKVQCPTVRHREWHDFSKLFNTKKYSDVTLSVKGRVIYAHKNIVANKSSVFETIFNQDMSKTESKKVEIKDLDYNTACDFLYYIYTGNLRNDSTIDAFKRHLNLLKAADNYRVEPLKERCEKELPLLLTTGNVLDCLLSADLHSAVNLKKVAIDFIVKNAEEITSLPSYKSFVELHATLSIEVVRALVVKKHRTE